MNNFTFRVTGLRLPSFYLCGFTARGACAPFCIDDLPNIEIVLSVNNIIQTKKISRFRPGAYIVQNTMIVAGNGIGNGNQRGPYACMLAPTPGGQ